MIEIWTEVLPPAWRWTPGEYLGGTPEAVINIAENLEDHVIVYYDGEPCEHNGVYYLNRSDYIGKDILIAFNSIPDKLAQYNIYMTNWFHARDVNYKQFDERIVLSPYHQSIFGFNSRIIPHGINPDQFKNPQKIKGQCLFSSSPDRGADFLDSIWPDVSRETGAELIKTYRKDVSEKEMIDLYKSSEFWLHPGDGVELFCIAAAKAQVSGCIPVVVPNKALSTTIKFGVRTTKESFKDDLIKALKTPPPVESVTFSTWKEVAQMFLKNLGVLNGA